MQTTVVQETTLVPRKYAPATIITVMFLGWRIYVWLFGAIGILANPYYVRPTDLFAPVVIAEDGPGMSAGDLFVRAWTRWDGDHYLSIATRGYHPIINEQPNIAFFPLYPVLIAGLGRVFGGGAFASAVAGILISNTAFYCALLVLFRLIERDFSAALAFRTIAILLVFPTSFYFGVVYSESLALLLSVGMFWYIRRERWWLAGTLGLLLALTRLPGIFAAPLLAFGYLQSCGWNIRRVRWPILAAALPVLGLCLFMAYQWAIFGTPVAFFEAQRVWNQQLSPPWVIVLTTVKELSTQPASSHYWITFFGIWLLFLVLGLLALRRLPIIYSLGFWALTLPAFLSNKSISFPRYMLLGFPAFILLAQLLQSRRAMLRYAAVAMFLGTVSIMLYVNYLWVS